MDGIRINKDENLSFSYKLKKGETWKINKGKKFFTLSIFKTPLKIKGVASYCEDGKHCLFVDYDNCVRWLIEEDYRQIQRRYNLPPAYLFATKEEKQDGEFVGNYHLICLKKFCVREIYKILSKTHSDVNYVSMPLRNKYKNWILRVSNKNKRAKPKFIKLVGEMKNLNFEISSPHLKLLRMLYSLPNISYYQKDNLKKIFWQEYETLNF